MKKYICLLATAIAIFVAFHVFPRKNNSILVVSKNGGGSRLSVYDIGRGTTDPLVESKNPAYEMSVAYDKENSTSFLIASDGRFESFDMISKKRELLAIYDSAAKIYMTKSGGIRRAEMLYLKNNYNSLSPNVIDMPDSELSELKKNKDAFAVGIGAPIICKITEYDSMEKSWHDVKMIYSECEACDTPCCSYADNENQDNRYVQIANHPQYPDGHDFKCYLLDENYPRFDGVDYGDFEPIKTTGGYFCIAPHDDFAFVYGGSNSPGPAKNFGPLYIVDKSSGNTRKIDGKIDGYESTYFDMNIFNGYVLYHSKENGDLSIYELKGNKPVVILQNVEKFYAPY